MVVISGIDQALTESGIGTLETTVDGYTWSTSVVRSPSKARLAAVGLDFDEVTQALRIRAIATSIAERIPARSLVVVEGLAFDAHDTSRKLAGLRWTLLEEVRRRECRIRSVGPQQRAKYATGNGRASKDEVLAAVREQYPGAEVPNHNVADAVTLAAIGARIAGHPVEAHPAAHHVAVVESLAWRW